MGRTNESHTGLGLALQRERELKTETDGHAHHPHDMMAPNDLRTIPAPQLGHPTSGSTGDVKGSSAVEALIMTNEEEGRGREETRKGTGKDERACSRRYSPLAIALLAHAPDSHTRLPAAHKEIWGQLCSCTSELGGKAASRSNPESSRADIPVWCLD